MRNLSELSKKDLYFRQLFEQEPHPVFAMARKASDEFNKTGISLTAHEARIVGSVVAANKSKKFVEIGTLTGYSALWIAMGLQDQGELYSFELDAAHAEKAQAVFSEAANCTELKNKKFKVILGDAEEKLSEIEAFGPFDGIFLDGNKGAYGKYLAWAEKHVRKGGLIIADNVFLGGSVVGEEGWGSAKQTETMLAVNRRLADTKYYLGSIVPTSEGMFVATKLF